VSFFVGLFCGVVFHFHLLVQPELVCAFRCDIPIIWEHIAHDFNVHVTPELRCWSRVSTTSSSTHQLLQPNFYFPLFHMYTHCWTRIYPACGSSIRIQRNRRNLLASLLQPHPSVGLRRGLLEFYRCRSTGLGTGVCDDG
jgi:hypothetical protein